MVNPGFLMDGFVLVLFVGLRIFRRIDRVESCSFRSRGNSVPLELD